MPGEDDATAPARAAIAGALTAVAKREPQRAAYVTGLAAQFRAGKQCLVPSWLVIDIAAALQSPPPMSMEARREAIARIIVREAYQARSELWAYEAADAILALTPVEGVGMRAALTKCRDQFAFYAREHRAAGKDEKATTNQTFADLCDAALSTPIAAQGDGDVRL